MAREYFCAYHSYLKSVEPLNDAERGRLFTACLQYSATGEVPDLRGNERFVFPMIREQIDRDRTKYEDFSKKQSDNARMRWHAVGCGGISGNAKNAKEKKKEKEKENITPPTPSRGDVFDEFWSLYPKKVGKQAAFNAWKKIKPSSTLATRILDAVKAQREWEQWKRDNGQYIPNPATWLNQGRWDDEQASVQTKEVDRYADLI